MRVSNNLPYFCKSKSQQLCKKESKLNLIPSRKASNKKPTEVLQLSLNPPIDGKANRELIKILANYFQTSKANITLKAGFTSRQKIVDIECD